MALSLNIGSPAVALVQNPAVEVDTAAPSGATRNCTLPVASTAGTTLVAILGVFSSNGVPDVVVSAPPGWVRQVSQAEATYPAAMEIWVYVGNPGGILTVPFQVTPYGSWATHISEWANVVNVSALDASGGASATAGTTLAPTTSSNVTTSNDIAISAWVQAIAAPAVVAFTTPAGWTRLIDQGSTSLSAHFDAEYIVGPATGAPLGPTLTSDHTSTSAVGCIICLKPAPPITDMASYIRYDSMTLQLNTLDFTLIDCPTPIQVMSSVTLSSPGDFPDWAGTVAQVMASDLVDIISGHSLQQVTCTNTQLPNFTNAPYNLSDNPAVNTTDVWLLENGDFWQLEDGSGNWLLESSIQEEGYRELSIGQQVGSVGPPITLTTLGDLITFRPQLWPGMTFQLTSSNLAKWVAVSGGVYTIQTINITWHGANPPLPIYHIQFGDRIQTLAEWTALH